jgi:hypothetical protein
LDERGLGFVCVERVAGGRTPFAFGEGEVGDFLQFGDVGDDAGIDQPLGKCHEVAGVAQGVADEQGLGPREETGVDAESGEPAGVVVHGRQ